jgi:hypothetical protein
MIVCSFPIIDAPASKKLNHRGSRQALAPHFLNASAAARMFLGKLRGD